jgi:hypothetical protein
MVDQKWVGSLTKTARRGKVSALQPSFADSPRFAASADSNAE